MSGEIGEQTVEYNAPGIRWGHTLGYSDETAESHSDNDFRERLNE